MSIMEFTCSNALSSKFEKGSPMLFQTKKRLVAKTIPVNQILLHVTLELLIHLVAHLLSSIYREKPMRVRNGLYTMHQHALQC